MPMNSFEMKLAMLKEEERRALELLVDAILDARKATADAKNFGKPTKAWNGDGKKDAKEIAKNIKNGTWKPPTEMHLKIETKQKTITGDDLEQTGDGTPIKRNRTSTRPFERTKDVRWGIYDRNTPSAINILETEGELLFTDFARRNGLSQQIARGIMLRILRKEPERYERFNTIKPKRYGIRRIREWVPPPEPTQTTTESPNTTTMAANTTTTAPGTTTVPNDTGRKPKQSVPSSTHQNAFCPIHKILLDATTKKCKACEREETKKG